MRFIGVDIASERHWVAAVGEDGGVLLKPAAFNENAEGYGQLFELVGDPSDTLVAMEATGHYWKNLFAVLAAKGFRVALLNPIRTRKFAEENLERTKTDAIDALGIARFAAQKRPAATPLTDEATEEIRELVQHRARMVQDFGDRTRQLRRLVDLGFPEFIKHVKGLDTQLATTILHEWPTAYAFLGLPWKRLAKIKYDDRHTVGPELAKALVEAAKTSVGQHHGPAYRIQIQHTCEDLDVLRRRIASLDEDIETKLGEHEVGKLLTTFEGIGPTTAARLIARLGDLSKFKNGDAISSFVGVVPSLRQSGRRTGNRAGISPIGDSELRSALWMPTLVAVRKNPWLKAHYERLRARGKLPKVALIACMRKMLCALYSIAKNRRPFTPNLAPAGT